VEPASGAQPYERVWQHLKQGLRWKLPKTLKQLQRLVSQRLDDMTQDVIESLTGRASILEALSVAGI
jgi:hypothetical protein